MTGRPVVLIAGGGTGGHLMPALAIATRIRATCPAIEPVLVGTERGIEAHVLPTRDFRYALLPSEPIYRRTWWRNARWPLVAWRISAALRRLYAAERPVAVLGTGGYASGPVVWWGARRGLPTAIQEQNAYPGLATRLLSRRVDQIYLGVPEAEARLKLSAHTKVFDTGNPIAPPDPERREAALLKLGLDGTRPVLLVTGGSQGSLAVNQAFARWLAQRGRTAPEWQILWVTGRATHAEFAHWHQPPMVQVIDFLDPMADAYAVTNLVISRAGMMTVAELCAWGLPAILIPLPTAAADHQWYNAKALADAGAACMLVQSSVERDGLGPTIEPLLLDRDRRDRMANLARERGRPDAARAIVSLFTTLFAS